MTGVSVTSFLPLNLTAFERSDRLLEWVGDVCGDVENVRFLDPEGWFSDAHEYGSFVWAPPPAAADVVVEQFSQAKHKRPESLHLIVVPRVMTAQWRKHLTHQSH